MKKKSESCIKNKTLTLNHFFSTSKKQNKKSQESTCGETQLSWNENIRDNIGFDDSPEFRMTLASLAKKACPSDNDGDVFKKLQKISGRKQFKKRKLHTLDSDVQKFALQSFFETNSNTRRKVQSNIKKKAKKKKPEYPVDSTFNLISGLKENIDHMSNVEVKNDCGDEEQNIKKLMQKFDNEIESFTDTENTIEPLSTKKVRTKIIQNKSSNILFALQERCIMDGKNNRRMRLLRNLPLPRNKDIIYSATPSSQKQINTIIHQLALSNKIKLCPTVQFSTNRNLSTNNQNQNRMRGKITSLEIDSKGILIATASSRGDILVYDFDELNTLDLKCRNLACRENVAAEMAADSFGKSSVYSNNETSEEALTLDGGKVSSYHQNTNSDISNSKKTTDVGDSYRNERRYKQRFLKPVIELNLNIYVNCVKWNPDNEDQLAVSFMHHHQVKIFDLGSSNPTSAIPLVSPNVSRQNCDGNNCLLFISMKPTICYDSTSIKLREMIRNTRLVVGSNDGIVRMWSLSNSTIAGTKKKNNAPKLLWSVNAFFSQRNDCAGGRAMMGMEAVSDISLLGPDYRNIKTLSDYERFSGQYSGLLLIGGNRGTIALLDSIRCTRKAFSTSHTPTILKLFHVSKMLQNSGSDYIPYLPTEGNFFGVKKICLWNYPLQYDNASSTKNNIVSINEKATNSSKEARWSLALEILSHTSVSVVINGGWAVKLCLGMEYNDGKLLKAVSNLHTTKRALSVTCSKEHITENFKKLSWSHPETSCPGYPMPNSSLLCIGDVPQYMEILPDSDNRVSQADLSRELEEKRENAILFVDTHGYNPCSFQANDHANFNAMDVFGKVQIDGNPSEIIVHPSEEWIVVGFSQFGALSLLSSRA